MSHAAAAEPSAPRLTTAVQWLIAINVAVFFLQLTVVSPADMIALLGFRSGDLSRTWWTTLTYMFVHGGFWHVALNMYVLLLFGPRVEREWSGAEFARFYVMCGMGGLLMHLLFFRDATLVGASAAVYGVMLAYAKLWPDDEIYLFAVIPLKVKWLIALLVLTDLVSGLSGGPTRVAHFAHLGGFLTGWLYLRAADAVRGDGIRARIAPAPDFGDETPRAIPRGLPRPRPAERSTDPVDDVVARSKAALARPTAVRAAPPLPVSAAEEADLDHLLDKISRHGLESLTEAELRLLEEASRRMRGE
ncbi:MAG TPA: rhomboid family intramembrane serine protease [Gemmatimonadaceae bacterium]|nr:rhomboid family intramembrane serine protease [Gemmatimonadaceae bacterium]